MVVDWEHLAIVTGKFVLFLLEQCIKLSAFIVTVVVLAAQGTFAMKLGTGFSSISPALRTLVGVPADLGLAFNLIYEYNRQPTVLFFEQYGNDAISNFMAYLNGGVIYLQSVAQNFANQPFATFFSAVIAFTTLYLTSQVLRFYRQGGKGSKLSRIERKLGEYFFNNKKIYGKPEILKESEIKSSSGQKQPEKRKPFRSFGKSYSNNSHLDQYIRQAKNGGE